MNNSPIKISVIVPVYNVEKYLCQCLESIIQQSYKDLEIIVVNDGSTDNSGLICDRYAAKDKRVQVIHQNNAGVSVARNTGIKSATGEYIAFVDSDDWLDTNMYQSMVAVVKENPGVDLVMCDFSHVANNQYHKTTNTIRHGYYSKSQIISDLYLTLFVAEDFGKIPIVSACTCLMRRDVLSHSKILFDTALKYSEDYLFMSEIVLNMNSFYYLKNKSFYNYRQRIESRSKKYQSDWWQVQMELNRKLKNVTANNLDYNFERQLKLQIIYSGLFVSNRILGDDSMKTIEKIKEIRQIFNQPELKSAIQSFKFKKLPFTLRVILCFMKYRMANSYYVFQKLIHLRS